jgi:hypothetical protein
VQAADTGRRRRQEAGNHTGTGAFRRSSECGTGIQGSRVSALSPEDLSPINTICFRVRPPSIGYVLGSVNQQCMLAASRAVISLSEWDETAIVPSSLLYQVHQ